MTRGFRAAGKLADQCLEIGGHCKLLSDDGAQYLVIR